MTYPPQQPQYVIVRKPPTSGLAIASMIFGIIGFVSACCTFGVFSVVAVLLGHNALAEIKRTGKEGRGMAIAGLILGYFLVIPAILLSIQVVLGAGLQSLNR